MVNHRVGVLHAHAVSAALLLEQIHQGVVMFLVLPVALELQKGSDGRQPRAARLDDAGKAAFWASLEVAPQQSSTT